MSDSVHQGVQHGVHQGVQHGVPLSSFIPRFMDALPLAYLDDVVVVILVQKRQMASVGIEKRRIQLMLRSPNMQLHEMDLKAAGSWVGD